MHIGLPADGMALSQAVESETHTPPPSSFPLPEEMLLAKIVSLFKNARRPLLAIGLTAIRMGVQALIMKLIDKHRVPVVLTPMAKGMLPEDHPCYAGVLAHACSDIVAQTHQQADLVVGIGFDPVELNYEDWMTEEKTGI